MDTSIEREFFVVTYWPEFEADFKPWSKLNERERAFFLEDDETPFPAHYEERLGVISGPRARQLIRQASHLLSDYENVAISKKRREEKFLLHDVDTPEKCREVTQWLHDRGVPFATTVYLLYDDLVVRCDWKFVVQYWDEIYHHVGIAMEVTDLTNTWVCQFHHEDVITFFRYVDPGTTTA